MIQVLRQAQAENDSGQDRFSYIETNSSEDKFSQSHLPVETAIVTYILQYNTLHEGQTQMLKAKFDIYSLYIIIKQWNNITGVRHNSTK